MLFSENVMKLLENPTRRLERNTTKFQHLTRKIKI